MKHKVEYFAKSRVEEKLKYKKYQDQKNHGISPSKKELVVKLSQNRDQVSRSQDCFLPLLAGIHN